MSRPQPAEYDAYYEKYVSLVPEDEVITALAAQPDELEQLFRKRARRKGNVCLC